MELQRIQAEMTDAMKSKDMGLVTTLAVKFAEVDSKPAEPIRTVPKRTGRTKAQAWDEGMLSDQRANARRLHRDRVPERQWDCERQNGRCLRR
jgi:hypothetical protein